MSLGGSHVGVIWGAWRPEHCRQQVREGADRMDQDLTHVACLFQYALNERKLLELRTEIVELVRIGTLTFLCRFIHLCFILFKDEPIHTVVCNCVLWKDMQLYVMGFFKTEV